MEDEHVEKENMATDWGCDGDGDGSGHLEANPWHKGGRASGKGVQWGLDELLNLSSQHKVCIIKRVGRRPRL